LDRIEPKVAKFKDAAPLSEFIRKRIALIKQMGRTFAEKSTG
jgi:hypothetical protein